jgi:hypothetical protein
LATNRTFLRDAASLCYLIRGQYETAGFPFFVAGAATSYASHDVVPEAREGKRLRQIPHRTREGRSLLDEKSTLHGFSKGQSHAKQIHGGQMANVVVSFSPSKSALCETAMCERGGGADDGVIHCARGFFFFFWRVSVVLFVST